VDEDKLQALERENKLLRAVLDAIHEGVQISDKDGVMVLYNSAAEKFEGLNRDQVEGKKISDIYNGTDESAHGNVLRTGKPLIEQYHQYYAKGERVNLIASTYPYLEGDEVVAVYSINRDVTKMTDFIAKTIELQNRLSSNRKGLAGKKNKGRESEGIINGTSFTFDDIIGTSDTMKQVITLAKKFSNHNSSVLIYGETGTGKELFAQSIHNAGSYADGPFIAINCAAIPETLLESIVFGTVKGAFTGAVESPGLFEQAESGTLFLDEVNSMGLNLQAKLLRVIQDKVVRRIGDNHNRTINCRIICSTNKDPLDAVQDGEIRQDLYYRLAAVILYIPPLRERKEDIVVLSNYFLRKYNKQFGTTVDQISEDLLAVLMKHSWPGNVRELEHMIESSMNMVDPGDRVLTFDHLPLYLRKKFTGQNDGYRDMIKYSCKLNIMLQEFEKRIIKETLLKNSWNISQTSKELGIFRQALQYRIKRYNIKLDAGLDKHQSALEKA
jgi:arginine utilization regulatory protein